MALKNNPISRKSYELPLLRSLVELGGSAIPDDRLYRLVAEKMGFVDEHMEYDLVHAREKWIYVLQWVRYNLVQQGEIDGSKRGLWVITERGRERVNRGGAEAVGVRNDVPPEVSAPSVNSLKAGGIEQILARYHQYRVEAIAQVQFTDILRRTDLLAFWIEGEQEASKLLASILHQYLLTVTEEVVKEIATFEDVASLRKVVSDHSDEPAKHKAVQDAEFKKQINRLKREFLNEFSKPDGGINWEKLVAFNNGRDKPKRSKFAREGALEEGCQATLE